MPVPVSVKARHFRYKHPRKNTIYLDHTSNERSPLVSAGRSLAGVVSRISRNIGARLNQEEDEDEDESNISDIT